MTLFNSTPLYIVSLCTMQLTKFCLPPWTFIHIVGPDLPQDAAHAKHTYNTSRIFCASFQSTILNMNVFTQDIMTNYSISAIFYNIKC